MIITGDPTLVIIDWGRSEVAAPPPPAFITIPPGNDFVNYIFQFPDQGTYLRDTIINQLRIQGFTGVSLLIYNPVDSKRQRPKIGNPLVFPPQLAQSSVALPGYWGMITIKGGLVPRLLTHPNIQIVNDQTLMGTGKPSVVLSKIDITHINIIINSFGVFVRDGLSFVALTLEDGTTTLTLEDGSTPLTLEGGP